MCDGIHVKRLSDFRRYCVLQKILFDSQLHHAVAPRQRRSPLRVSAGSTLYLVWQQERLSSAHMDDFGVGRAFGSLLNGDGTSALVVKWSYRYNR